MSSTSKYTQPQSPRKKKAKLNNWISSSFDSAFQFEDSKNEIKKRKHSKHAISNKNGKENSSDKTWLEKYVPKIVDDLAVHKKKILEVETWILQNNASNKSGAPILLLSGPSGCGKTATIAVLAQKHDILIEEWTSPLSIPFSLSRQIGVKYQSEITQFEEFLFRSGKYNSVLKIIDSTSTETEAAVQAKLILLEELPNFLYRDPSLINDLLRKYQRSQRWPLVLIISDGAATDPVKRALRCLPITLTTINFNPISVTLMSKALSRICSAERRNVSKEDVTMLSSTGDIRAAINCLQFSSQFDLTDSEIDQTSPEVARLPPQQMCCSFIAFCLIYVNTKQTRLYYSESLNVSQKRKKAFQSSSCIAAKDSTLILFRALGKIFYCKRKKPPDDSVEIDRRYRDLLLLQPEEILEQCCLSGSAFSLFLHHNYLSFFNNNPLDDVTSAAELLSVADTLNSPLTLSDPTCGGSLFTDRYEGILSARCIIYSNSLRATSKLCASTSGGWRPMHKPSWYEVRRAAQENSVAAHQLFWKRKEDLPMFVNLASRFDPPQRNFLKEVIAIPKWKTFRSFSDRVSEHEIGDEEPKIEETSSGGDVDVNIEVDDDDVIIEEFSD